MILYKYCSFDRIDVLDRCLIRYTQPAAFNDPFEVRPYVSQLSSPAEFEETIDGLLAAETIRVYDQLADLPQNIVSYDFFQTELKKRREDIGQAMHECAGAFVPMLRSIMHRKLNELLGILSLAEKADDLLMWSHYATSHEGFVIGFDSTHRYFNAGRSPKDELYHLRRVQYRERRPQAPLTSLTSTDVFLVKSTQWAYEREWRIIRPLADADEVIPCQPYQIHLFKFPADSIREIALGCRMHRSYRSDILDILYKRRHFTDVKVLQAVPDEKQFKIVFKEL